MIGKTILHYKILAKLGEGGMGVVYKAEDTKLKRIVAIKFLPRHIAASAEERERFKIEAQAAAALNHPNIATIYAIEEVNDEMFIVMEFIDGQEFKKLIIDNSQLTIDNCLAYATQIAEGLKAAHAKGITHRDIKSSNVMVTESGQVKIMDFGLAKIGSGAHLTKSGMTLGTTAYMSPEQARGEPVDHRTDIWSFGVVLYETLTGQLPFKGVYEQAIMYAIVNETPEPLTHHRTDVSTGLQHIIDKALDKEPESRYQRIEDMLADLKSPLTSKPAKTVKPSLLQRRRTFLYGGIAASLILLIAVGYYFVPERSRNIDSIAVLPLANLSGDPNKEFFADGMTEALISDLGQIGSLRVISRTSVMQYKGGTKPLPAIARELNVKAVVEGAVQSSGDRVNISVRLIEAATEKRLWSESFERELRNVLTLQKEVALAIAGEIEIRVIRQEQARLQEARVVDPEAYKHYLWGLSFRDKLTKEGMQQAIKHFEQAIAIDPNFAQAYAALTVPYLFFEAFNLMPKEEAIAKRRQVAAKALELDETLPEAHTAMGVFREFNDWDWSGAEKEFRRAIKLNPSYADAHNEYGLFLCRRNRAEEGLAELKRALDLDPFSENFNEAIAEAYIFNRQYDEAIEHCLKMFQLNPNFRHVILGKAYLMKGRYEEAIAVLETKRGSGPLGSAYALSGKREKALKVLNELKAQLERGDDTAMSIAAIYVSLGEKDKALAMLERDYEQRGVWFVAFIIDPIFDPLRSEPRFLALLKKMGLEK